MYLKIHSSISDTPAIFVGPLYTEVRRGWVVEQLEELLANLNKEWCMSDNGGFSLTYEDVPEPGDPRIDSSELGRVESILRTQYHEYYVELQNV